MPAKFTQQTVEHILKEQGLKVSEWPSGKYVNGSEKVLLSCEHGHFYWDTLRNPLCKKKGCSRCRGGWTRTQDEWETAASDKGFKIVSWVFGNKGVKSRVMAVCPNGHSNETTVDNIVNGRGRCMSCGRDSASKTRSTPIDSIEVSLRAKGLSEIVFLGKHRGLLTKVEVKCNAHGHKFTDTAGAILSRKFGCVSCSPVARKTDAERVKQIESAGNVFIEWCDKNGAASANSVVKVMCHNGHVRTATVDRLVHGKTKCPACISFGYNPEKTGFLYALLSSDGLAVKIGITNNLRRRERELARLTPFTFKRVGVIRGSGHHIVELEKQAHSEFKSANFSGFNGATEWLVWGPEVHRWLVDNA